MKLGSYRDIEVFLSSKRPDIKAVNWFFTLDDMKKFMSKIDNPQDKYNVVHIAGTSGKTSTTYYLAKMLELSGQKTGLTVSPHVDSINERVQINGIPLDEDMFIEYFQEFIELPAVQSMEITYFGLLVAFAYWFFDRQAVDYAVVEVGMGGRLDATNVVNNPGKTCVITDIGLDHTKFLGNTLPEIAREKAGIIQDNQHVFVANQDKKVMDVFKDVSASKKAYLHIMPESLIDKAPSHLPTFQKRNWSLAKFTFEFIAKRDGINIEPEKLIQSTKILVPARMEEIRLEKKVVILDGSHNAQKITALVQAIMQKHPGKKASVLISMVEGKDSTLGQSLDALRDISDNLIVTEFTSSQDIHRKAIKTASIAKEAKKSGFTNVHEVVDPKEAFGLLLSQSEELLLVTGSFFLLNHIRPLAKSLRHNTQKL